MTMKLDIVCFTGQSGLTDYAVSLARALSRLADTRLVTAASLPDRFDHMGFVVQRLFRRSRHYPIDILRFAASALHRRPDWLLLQGPLKFATLDALLVRALRFFGLRACITVHDTLPHYPKPWSTASFGFYFRSFDRVIAHSVAAEQALRSMGVSAPVLVVPHGVYDLFKLAEMDRATARRALGLNDEEHVVLFFGHLESRKGLGEFLAAADRLKTRGPWRFIVAGERSLAAFPQALEQRLAAARQASHVLLHDRRIPFEEVQCYFAACDIVALPYREGTTSGVLKLAMAFGRAVVATRVGDFPEQTPPGAGQLIANDEHLVDRLCDALEDVRVNLPEHEAAMRRARQTADWPGIAARVRAHLEDAR